ncbi:MULTISPECIES: DUF6213 family protein [unclassified Streptomyces]|uniref:DUF6213 family protein n=1 Tax=unclassified Streptomyces TaxID=2593676 RepID=UPI002E104BAF|nr:DUF6213 family protein [Streptomyces sp. NBC_01197]WSS47433.1 DUF6213 family protein [Streptomyces sp. NBC_01180]
MNRDVMLALVPDEQGVLHVAAADVSHMLRTLGAGWLQAVRDDASNADEDTVAALTIELAKLADQIDVECIAHTSKGDGDGESPLNP